MLIVSIAASFIIINPVIAWAIFEVNVRLRKLWVDDDNVLMLTCFDISNKVHYIIVSSVKIC